MDTVYFVDSIIEYRTFTGSLRKVRVTEKSADIKNGRPGFDGYELDGPYAGGNVWGYDDQIVRVVSI